MVLAYFHRPHSQKEIDKGVLVFAKKFLENIRVKTMLKYKNYTGFCSI
ncbi:hypothetical protein PRO82_001981 [Candidatus Protochlamydia amoebophila]|nr:hypothetical protein [Candidatus Protochlamydia amoebophila]